MSLSVRWHSFWLSSVSMHDRPRSQVCNSLRGRDEACVSTTATKCLLTLLSLRRSQFNSTMASHLRSPSLAFCSGRRRQKSEGRGRGIKVGCMVPSPPLLQRVHSGRLSREIAAPDKHTFVAVRPNRPSASVRRRPRRFSPT